MSFLVNYFATLLYAAAAFGLAYGLPRAVPGVEPAEAYAVGGLALVCLILVHVVLLLGGLRRRMAGEIVSLRAANDGAMKELGNARAEAQAIRQAIEEAETRREAKTGGKGAMRSFEDVVAEVRVLQGLIGKLSAVNRSPANSPQSATPAAAASGVEAVDPAKSAESAEPPKNQPRPLPPVAEGLDEAQILSVVREGLSCDRVDLVLQPIVSLPQRKHSFYECFSRIHDGNGQIITPDQYLEIARDSGLMAPIDNMLLFRCVQLVRRMQKAQRNIGFFCNISSHSLADTVFLRDFIAFMADNTELAPKLVFEFAQADVAGMDEGIAYNLHRLGDLGFRFSMDQVSALGMDYAELSRHRFRFLKIDAAILLKHIRGEDDEIDLRYFKRMLDRLAIDLVVEKIESETDLIELLDFNIDFGQGYLFGKPRLTRGERAA